MTPANPVTTILPDSTWERPDPTANIVRRILPATPPAPSYNPPETRQWEQVEGSGKPLTISQVISHLQAILSEQGDIACQIRNYLEENCLAPLTDCSLDKGNLVFESNDPAADDYRQTV